MTQLFSSQVVIQTGSHDIPSASGTSLPAGFVNLLLTIDTAGMPVANSFDWHIDLSYDAGATWRFCTGGTTKGGSFTNKAGQPTTLSQYIVSIPQSPYPDNVRIHTDATVSSTVTVTLSTL